MELFGESVGSNQEVTFVQLSSLSTLLETGQDRRRERGVKTEAGPGCTLSTLQLSGSHLGPVLQARGFPLAGESTLRVLPSRTSLATAAEL